MRIVFALLMIVIVTACASSPPRSQQRFIDAPAPPPDYATLYIYRGYMDNGAAVWPIVYLNGVKVADIKTYSYTYVYIRPGKYHLHAGKSFALAQFADEEYEFNFEIPSEGTYYLQFRNGGGPNVTLPAGRTFVTFARSRIAASNPLLVPAAHANRKTHKEFEIDIWRKRFRGNALWITAVR